MDISARRQAVKLAQIYRDWHPVFLDTETTGIGAAAEVIEIAIVDHQGTTLLDSLVKPRGAIEPDAARIHGIQAIDLQHAPAWDRVWAQVEPILAQRKVGIYNLEFDTRIIQQTHQRFWINWQMPGDQFFCVMKLYAQFAGEWDRRRGSYRWHSLENAGKQCEITLPNVHRALGDALLTRALFEYMVNWQ